MSGHTHTRFRNDDGPWSPCPPTCPLAPRVTPEELRDVIVNTLFGRVSGGLPGTLKATDALLSGPLAPLLAAQAAVERVEALAAHWDTDADARYSRNRIARHTAARVLREALDGPT